MEHSNITVPIHGNYHGYYNKRQATQDARLSLLPKSIFLDKRVLDIGCNEGFVTCEVAQLWGAQEVIGVDIDDSLIRAAWKRRRSLWSQKQPLPMKAVEVQPAKKRKLDNDDPASALGAPGYFPAAFEHMFGSLPIPSVNPDSYETSQFPHNISFRTTDWVKDGAVEDRQGYDIVLAFSITKWIHLNDGDDGIKSFFRRIFSALRPGGTFILEPQEWSSYGKTKRMNPILKEKAKNLQLRPDGFSQLLKDTGFVNELALRETGEGGTSK